MSVQRLSTGIDLSYESHGQGEPLVLIPATGFSADVWLSHQVSSLSQALRIITFDQRGTGRSSAPEGVYTMGQLSADVVALLDHLDIEQAQALAERIPGAELRVLPGRSHGFFWQAAEETNAWIIEWVRGHAAGAA